jgi:hypothetical protein
MGMGDERGGQCPRIGIGHGHCHSVWIDRHFGLWGWCVFIGPLADAGTAHETGIGLPWVFVIMQQELIAIPSCSRDRQDPTQTGTMRNLFA